MRMSSALVSLLRRAGIACGILAALPSFVLANNVRAVIEGSLLKINGDNNANQLTISQTTGGDTVVTGRNGTTINGVPSARFRGTPLNAFEILLEGGSDNLIVRNTTIANDLFVNLGAGDDRLTVSSALSVGANASIECAEGNDTVRVSGMAIGNDLNLDGGLGVLRADLLSINSNKGINIVSDESADAIKIDNSTAADYVMIETKGGNDLVSVSGLVALGVGVNVDVGIDKVSLTDCITMEDIGIFTGVGNDWVSLANVASSKSLTVSVDAGSDYVIGSGVSVAEDAVFEGGAGFDTLEDLGITAGIKFDIKEFESVLP
jgi:hypothetical protein